MQQNLEDYFAAEKNESGEVTKFTEQGAQNARNEQAEQWEGPGLEAPLLNPMDGASGLAAAKSVAGAGLRTAGTSAGDLAYAAVRSRGYTLTDRMSRSQYDKLVKSIKTAGIQNKVINYVKVGDDIYIVLGNNRLMAAKQVGKTGELIFREVQLPFRGYKTAEDVLMGAGEAAGGR